MIKYTEKDVRDLPKLEREYKKLAEKAHHIERERIKLFIRLTHVKSITEFHENIPLFFTIPFLHDTTHMFEIRTVPENHLMAQIYHNANMPQEIDKWGLRVYDFTLTSVFKDRFLGAHFQKDEAIKIAKDWVIGKDYRKE